MIFWLIFFLQVELFPGQFYHNHSALSCIIVSSRNDIFLTISLYSTGSFYHLLCILNTDITILSIPNSTNIPWYRQINIRVPKKLLQLSIVQNVSCNEHFFLMLTVTIFNINYRFMNEIYSY